MLRLFKSSVALPLGRPRMPSLHLSRTRRWLLSSPPAEWGVQQLRSLVIGALRQGPIPQHVAFVMDGNRRFARTHRIETVEGHNLGFEALARILEVCYRSGVKVVTIYAFSIENFKRSKYEVDALMDMAKVKLAQLAQHGDVLDRYGACIRVLGRRELVRPDVLEAIDRAVGLTRHNQKAVLNVCFPYTSRDEITAAIRDTVNEYSRPLPESRRPFSESRISQTIRSRNLQPGSQLTLSSTSLTSISDAEDSVSTSSTLHPDTPVQHSAEAETVIYPDPESIDTATIDRHLFTAGNPPLDLLVRTSGVERLSDFMLWQCHQDTKVVFLECLWPEFDLWNFLPVLLEWQWQRKTVGRIDAMTIHTRAGEALKA